VPLDLRERVTSPVRATASERSGESELLEPRGFRKDVDRDDLAVRDGEAQRGMLEGPRRETFAALAMPSRR
jgi:hypothetical protein